VKKLALITACTFVIMSCSTPRPLEYKTYHNFAIKSLGFNNATVSLDLEYYNPNNFGMQLKRTDLDIFINGTLLGHSTSDSLIRIPKNGNFILPVKFELDMRNAFKNAFSALFNKEVMVKLTGKIKAGKGNLFLNFPVNYESKQKFSFF